MLDMKFQNWNKNPTPSLSSSSLFVLVDQKFQNNHMHKRVIRKSHTNALHMQQFFGYFKNSHGIGPKKVQETLEKVFEPMT